MTCANLEATLDRQSNVPAYANQARRMTHVKVVCIGNFLVCIVKDALLSRLSSLCYEVTSDH